MVPSFVKPSLTTSSLLLALFLISSVFSFCSARTVKVNDICSKHIHPANCNDLLHNIPGTSSGNVSLHTFVPLTLYLNSVNAYEGLNLVGYLVDTTTDPKWKERYTKCFADYIKAVISVERAQKSLISDDFEGMKSNIGEVVVDVKDCSEMAPGDTSVLPGFNGFLEDMSIISQILADYKAGKY